MLVELLYKHKIKAVDSKETLVRVIKNPIEAHLPPGCRKVGLSVGAKQKIDISSYIQNMPKGPVAFFVGAFAHGQVDLSECSEQICISNFHLSAAVACGKICCAAEEKWEIF